MRYSTFPHTGYVVDSGQVKKVTENPNNLNPLLELYDQLNIETLKPQN